MLAYLRSDGFRDSPPGYLVWEMPGYYDINDDGMLREALADAAGRPISRPPTTMWSSSCRTAASVT